MKMESAMEEGDILSQEEESWNEELDISQLCRICANPNEYLIPIFQGEGLEHELEAKIAKHLPIKVSESDELPTNLCYQCASTLIAWHDMVVGCVEADEKLRAVTHYKTEKNIVTREQDTKLRTPVEIEKVAVEEEITSVVPGIIEEATPDTRSLSFRNYQIAICALRDKLLNSKIKQPINTRNVTVDSVANTSMSHTTSSKKTITKQYGSDEVDSLNCNEVFVKSKHQCIICGRMFTRSYDLKRHSLVHLNSDVFETSGNSGSDRNAKQNLGSITKTIITHTCEVCTRVFKAKDSYLRHKRIHTNERPFCCNECGKCFRDSGALTRHTKEVHAKIRNHPCNICNKWFVNRATLEDHYRTHTGERPFVCHQCGVMFKSRAALYQHSKTHTNYLPHICIYCGKCFRRRQELVAHLPIHTNEKTHICEKCGKAFSTRSELHRHIIVHSDEKPFTCMTCGLNFSQKRYLKNHMKSRHGRTEDLQPSTIIPVERF